MSLPTPRPFSDVALSDETAATLEDAGDDPEMAERKTDTSEVLRECIEQLSPDQREVIELVYYHERSVEDVARIVGVPEGTVKTRMFHARRKLAELLTARGQGKGWP